MRARWVAIGLLLLGTGAARGQTALPDLENGRYALSPIADGVLRLDTRSGAVSTCKNDGAGWACYAAPDERAALDAEIGRLQGENDTLRMKLAQDGSVQGKIDAPLPKADQLPRADDGERKIEIPLPSDRDVNRFMGFLENTWRRLVDMAARMQRGADDKI